jgi:hypothetical protein
MLAFPPLALYWGFMHAFSPLELYWDFKHAFPPLALHLQPLYFPHQCPFGTCFKQDVHVPRKVKADTGA